jgi:phosphatidylglycerol:prolipoprotein diacylglycerol transferase
MHPQIFGIIKSYGLLLAISFGVGMWLAVRRGRPRRIPAETILDLIFAILVSSILGVRLFYVATHASEFVPWWRALFIWDGGLTLYGGILAAMAAVWWMCRRRKLRFLDAADIISPVLALGIGLTRIGCYLAGCCFGKPTTCALGVHFPADSPATRAWGASAVHPTQLYASAAGFAIFGLLLWAERLPGGRGATFGRFLMLYGGARIAEDYFRTYEPGQVLAGLSNNQWLSLALMAVGLVVLWRSRRPEMAHD